MPNIRSPNFSNGTSPLFPLSPLLGSCIHSNSCGSQQGVLHNVDVCVTRCAINVHVQCVYSYTVLQQWIMVMALFIHLFHGLHSESPDTV